MLETVHVRRWVAENRDRLRPPVGNVQLFKERWRNFIVMLIGGPNQRTDFHDDPGEELFYQLEGDIVLRVIEDGRRRDIAIPEGEMLLLPPHVRHSPQRPAGSVGLVIERLRLPGERDAFEWYCERCAALLHRHELELKDIETDLPPVFEAYYASERARTCAACGHRNPGRPERGAG